MKSRFYQKIDEHFYLMFTVIVLGFIALLASMSDAAISTKKKPEVPSTQAYTNPNTYLVGNVTEIFNVGTHEKTGMVVRVQPLSAPLLFTQDVLFCGFDIDVFENKVNPVVLTYRTKALYNIEGIGCHPLVRVDNMQGSTQ